MLISESKVHLPSHEAVSLTSRCVWRKDEAVPDLYSYVGTDGRTYQGYMPGGGSTS